MLLTQNIEPRFLLQERASCSLTGMQIREVELEVMDACFFGEFWVFLIELLDGRASPGLCA